MPDWSYRTLFRPVFFRLPVPLARDLALGVVGTLARLPLGPRVIDLLGHMRPPVRLGRCVHGIRFPSPVGLGAGIDTHAVALPALARFGFGFLEVGPVTVAPFATADVERRPGQKAIWRPDPSPGPGLEALVERLTRAGPLQVPLVVRLGHEPRAAPEKATEGCRQIVDHLAAHAAIFSLATIGLAAAENWGDDSWRNHVGGVVRAARAAARPVWLCVSADLDDGQADRSIALAREAGIDGVLVEGSVRADPAGRLLGAPARGPALRLVRRLRERWGAGLVLVSSGGVHEPEDALQLVAAGADLVQIDSGLVYGGPGLPKRVNEALLYANPAEGPTAEPPAAVQTTWFWTLLLGVSMLIGGLMATAVAASRVVLPYDEMLVGLSRADLARVADGRLLAFMAHDRISLAGTMVAIGTLYTLLSLHGVRRGLHWARQAILYSAAVGFLTFFLFLGFGYLDPFHAFVTVVLLQFSLFALYSRLPPPAETTAPNLRDDWRWRCGLWGQLMFVLEGFGLVSAGLVISGIGMTRVFVHEDLQFIRTTPEALAAVSPHLLPLIAHDRASFGGMLIAFGLLIELSALWGFRRGEWWLWLGLFLANGFAYGAALAVHFAVGYTNWWHLLPAYSAVALVTLGLILSYPYLCQPDAAEAQAWLRYRRRAGAG